MNAVSPPATDATDSTASGALRSVAGDLPSEVLVLIFYRLSEIHIPLNVKLNFFIIDKNRKSRDGNTDKLGWIKVTHVCRHWRKIALENPVLWGDITFMLGPNWTAAMMERAQTAPVALRRFSFLKDGKYVIGDEEREYIPKHIGHIQKLSLDAPNDVLGPLLESIVQPAPILELLQLSVSGGRQAPFPKAVFAGSAPRLQYAFLKGLSVSWDSPIFGPRLVRLEIKYPAELAQSVPTLAELLATLERMPALEVLELQNAIPPYTSCPEGSGDVLRVSLPRLWELKLTGKLRDCVQLAESLILPVTTQVRFVKIHGASEDFDHILPFLASRCYESEGVLHNLRSINISIYGSELEISVHLPWGTHRNGTGCHTAFEVEFVLPTADPTPADHTKFLQKIFTCVPLHDVKELRLSSYDRDIQFAVDDWLRVLGGMNNLEDVQVSDVGAMLFCEALVVDAKDYLERPSSRTTKIRPHRPENVFLPRLAKLTLDRVDFHEKFWEGISIFHMRLVALLQARKKWELPLKELDIDKCDITPSWASKLADPVETVTWDTIDDDFSGKWL